MMPKFIVLYEHRKQESWKHPATGYSLTRLVLWVATTNLLFQN
jgi:CRISP-associated protein Cas1